MRLILRLIKWAIASYLLMTAAILAWTFLWPERDLSDIAPADVIICMGGGMTADGTLAPATLTRVDRCVELYAADIAPIVLFTGGTARPNGPSAGSQMARYAQSIGLPADQAIIEDRAQSTLHNALFSLDLTTGQQDYIIVTEAFHLPRSWASFQWGRWELNAAPDKSFRLIMSEDVRRNPTTGAINWRILGRESVAIWFNIARAAAYSLAPDPSLDWLH